MRYNTFIVLATVMNVTLADSAPEADLVSFIPGLDDESVLSYKIYSGFLEIEDSVIPLYPKSFGDNAVGGIKSDIEIDTRENRVGFADNPSNIQYGKRYYHYVFMEAMTDPATKPVMRWLNGGPGATSTSGLFTEIGPVQTETQNFKTPDGKWKKVYHLFKNKYSWNSLVNVFVIDSPAGVGYSYCENKCPKYDDDLAASDNYKATMEFFKKFPEYAENDFYIMGESYGGIYVPSLAALVVDYSNLRLKGIAVGNGCTGILAQGGCGIDGYYWMVSILKDHGLIMVEHYDELLQECEYFMKHFCFFDMEKETTSRDEECVNPDNILCQESKKYAHYSSCKCERMIATLISRTGGFYPYDLYSPCWNYRDLYGNTSFGRLLSKFNIKYKNICKKYNIPSNVTIDNKISPRSIRDSDDYEKYVQPCGQEDSLEVFFNSPSVKEQFHIKNTTKYEMINWEANKNYYPTIKNMKPIYQKLMINNVRIMLYYGDVDSVVPYNGGQLIAKNLQLQEVESWRGWSVDGKYEKAGQIVNYEYGFQYVTIYGAGHMAPSKKPLECLKLLENFISNSPFLPVVNYMSIPEIGNTFAFVHIRERKPYLYSRKEIKKILSGKGLFMVNAKKLD